MISWLSNRYRRIDNKKTKIHSQADSWHGSSPYQVDILYLNELIAISLMRAQIEVSTPINGKICKITGEREKVCKISAECGEEIRRWMWWRKYYLKLAVILHKNTTLKRCPIMWGKPWTRWNYIISPPNLLVNLHNFAA